MDSCALHHCPVVKTAHIVISADMFIFVPPLVSTPPPTKPALNDINVMSISVENDALKMRQRVINETK